MSCRKFVAHSVMQKNKVLVTLADVRLGKSVMLVDICYEWNTKAEIVHVEAVSSVVALTSSSPLTGRFSAFQKNERVHLLPKQMYRYLYILHSLYP
jgi:hypothetical protein